MNKWSLEQKDFSGKLGIDSHTLNLRFKAGISKTGEVIIEMVPVSYTQETRFISDYFDKGKSKFSKFTLSGNAADGTEFKSDDIIFTSMNRKVSDDEHTICPRILYSKVHISLTSEYVELPLVRWHLKGFEAFHELNISTRLGSVQMIGSIDANKTGNITGSLVVQANSIPTSIPEWREEAEKLGRHVRNVMSFAAGKGIGFPITEFAYQSQTSVEVFFQSFELGDGMPIFHNLQLDAIFKCAVESHFQPPFEVKNLEFAIQWYLMRGSYREEKLISSMTVLENLIDSNLSQEDTLILTKENFEKLRAKLSNVVKAEVANWTDDATEQRAYIRELNNRFSDMKRKSLMDKIKLLANRWEVCLEGLGEEQIQAAKKARDFVVHQGSYRAKQGDSLDLHDHVLTTRELVARFILTVIGFKGKYYTYIGGWQEKEFLREQSPEKYLSDPSV